MIMMMVAEDSVNHVQGLFGLGSAPPRRFTSIAYSHFSRSAPFRPLEVLEAAASDTSSAEDHVLEVELEGEKEGKEKEEVEEEGGGGTSYTTPAPGRALCTSHQTVTSMSMRSGVEFLIKRGAGSQLPKGEGV